MRDNRILPDKGTLPKAILFLAWILSPGIAAAEFESEITLSIRAFNHSARFEDQANQHATAFAQFNWYQSFGDIWSFEIEPYIRLDSADEARSTSDLRRAFLLGEFDRFEFGIGIQQLFWGVTESTHLVDIVAQTDNLAALDQEEKLGQPLIVFSVPFSRGLFDLYLLPYFREQTFPEAGSRLRFETLIDGDNAQYEHPDEENHLDVAVRLNHSFAHIELGLSHFQGTARQPNFQFIPGPSGPVIQPYYAQIRQTGLELQGVWESWLLKLEAVYRSGQPDLTFSEQDYWASTVGFEYSFYSLFDTVQDLGLIVEYIYDDRGDLALTSSEQDWVVGIRWALNDLRSSEVLFLIIKDLDTAARTLVVEASSEIIDDWELVIESTIFSNLPPFNPLEPKADALVFDLRDDDYLELSLRYYF